MLRDLSLDIRRCRGCADGVVDNLHVRPVLIEADRRNQCTVAFSEPTDAKNIQLSKTKVGDARTLMGLRRVSRSKSGTCLEHMQQYIYGRLTMIKGSFR
jgi:hypothetical protein